MQQLEAYSDLRRPGQPSRARARRATRPARAAAQRRVFLGSGGADAIETAAKLARRYWHARGQPERTHLISRTNAYHGTHGFGTSLAGIPGNREGCGRLHTQVSVIPHDSVEALRREIDLIGPGQVAAFFVEPVIGAGGVLLPPTATSRRSRGSAASTACCSSSTR